MKFQAVGQSFTFRIDEDELRELFVIDESCRLTSAKYEHSYGLGGGVTVPRGVLIRFERPVED